MMKHLSETIEKAILAHSHWKHLLQNAIKIGYSHIPVKEAKDPTLCEFGKWLYSNEAAWLIRHYPQLAELHKTFHEEAGKILFLVLQNRTDEAKTHMQLGSDFNQSTAKLVNLLVEIRDHLENH